MSGKILFRGGKAFLAEQRAFARRDILAVSYTHLTLPTKIV